MSDQYPPDDLSLEPGPADRAALDSVDAILARPELWAEPSAGVEGEVISAILAGEQEAFAPPTLPDTPAVVSPPDVLPVRRDVRRLEARPGRGRTNWSVRPSEAWRPAG